MPKFVRDQFKANATRVLRQDPDVILIGEIRDAETAQLAIQASLTGHLVLATLHTNDAPSAIPRLIDIGIEPYLVTSSLLAVLAQRLVRRTCKVCGGTALVNNVRCDNCYGTGFRGRMAIYELMNVTDDLRRITGQNADSVTLYETAIKGGFRPMREDAELKAAQGLTTKEELFRVLH